MPIVRETNYETLDEVKSQLNTYAMEIDSYIRNVRLRLLYLTVTPAMYNTQSATPFVLPKNPGPATIVPLGATGPKIIEINRAYRHNSVIFKEYDYTDKAVKALLMSAIDKTYNCALQDRYFGYANVTTLETLMHLYTNYARITPNNYQENDNKKKSPLDTK